MIIYWRIPITVTLRAPWAIPGDREAGPALDIALARNSKGQFILPASLIKGNLRNACEELVREGVSDEQTCNALFGRESRAGGKEFTEDPVRAANEPERGSLIFDDLTCDQEVEDNGLRTQRVRINPEFGAAEDGHLLFVECPFAFNQDVTFSGDFLFYPGSRQNEADVRRILELGLGRLFAIGSMKSAGFGRVAGSEVGTPVPVSAAAIAAPGARLSISYEIDRPFLVDAQHPGSNLLAGSDVIPGGAIKGVLARGLASAGLDAEAFLSRELRIGHAAPEGRRVLPLSLSISDKKLYCNLGGEPKRGHHRFLPDWKGGEREAVCKCLGDAWSKPAPPCSGRTRTAIDTDTLSAKYMRDENGGEGAGLIFSQISVVPHGRRWHGEISAPKISEDLNTALALLREGLPGLGKTGAVIRAEMWEPTPSQDRHMENGLLDLCLATDACMFPPAQAAGRSVGDIYREYFEDIGFELVDWFALQTLKGGYLALRYPALEDAYVPWILTRAGSVFRLKPTAEARVSDILERGLPPVSGLKRENWETFPFLRENGFGQVVPDIVDHGVLKHGVDL